MLMMEYGHNHDWNFLCYPLSTIETHSVLEAGSVSIFSYKEGQREPTQVNLLGRASLNQ